MKKLITVLSTALVFCAAAMELDAQTLRKNKEFESFDKVEVHEAFVVTLENHTKFKADWEANADLMDYMDIYVRQNTLKVGLTKEGVKYLKKNYKKDNRPTLKITISIPAIRELNLEGGASIDPESEPMHSDKFKLFATDQVRIPELTMNVDGPVEINLKKDADVTMKMMADKISIAADQDAVMALTFSTKNMFVNLQGGASVGLAGDLDKLEVETKNSSKLNVQGKGDELFIQSKGVSEVEADNFIVDEAEVHLNSAVAWVNAMERLKLELSNTSTLIYSGDPKMEIVDVHKSSITRFENAEKKKK